MLSKYAIANIFALRDVNNVCRVTYDSSNQDAFVAHMEEKQVKFQCNDQGLYIYNPDNSYLEDVNKKNLIKTGAEKEIYQLQNNSGS